MGEHLPEDAAFKDEDDAGEDGPVVHARSATFGFGWLRWQKRLYDFPKLLTY